MRINRDTLFMRYPSTWWHDLWREGLPAGNGIIGVNVYGGVKEEVTMIQHHDLWHGGSNNDIPDVSDAFKHQRELIDKGDFLQASWEIVNELKNQGYDSKLESQLPIADLLMQIQPNHGYEDYIRGIHMDTGEIGAEWRDGASERSSYLFVSRTDNMIVKKIESSHNDLNILFTLDMHKNEGSINTETYTKHIIDTKKTDIAFPFLDYTAQNQDGTLYGVVVRIVSHNGIVEETPIGIRIKGSNEILVLMKTFVKENPSERNRILNALHMELESVNSSYNTLLERHIIEHQKLYQSSSLILNYQENFLCNEDLLADAYTGKQSVELIEKLWRYGRYLFICGTSEESNPFSMYGLWGGDYGLLWNHNMANENIQMIYWHSYVGNLLQLQKGFYKYYSDRIPEFQYNAKKIFGMNGIYMPAGSTPGISRPNQIVPVIINWVSAAGWLAQHYCLYYWYTRDEQYLITKLLPYLEEVAAFYEDFIEFYPDGKIHFYPSVSPENTPMNFMPPEHIIIPHPMPTTVNSTIDLAITKEFFKNLCLIARELELFPDKISKWQKIIESIPDYKVNELGAIKEWQDDRFEERYAHRHLSHIYPVFPGNEINKLHGSELLPAFRKAVELREIDAQTGWSLVHMAAIYARFDDGESAMRCLNYLSRSVLINNFFTLHNDWRKMNLSLCSDPPVQLDAIMGYVNTLQEMLLYVSNDFIKLLPALSKELWKGCIKRFRCIDSYLDMEWDIEKCRFEAVMTAIRKHEVCIQLPEIKGEFKFIIERCDYRIEKSLLYLRIDKEGYIKIINVNSK